MWDLSPLWIEPAPPALEGEDLTPGPPGRPRPYLSLYHWMLVSRTLWFFFFFFLFKNLLGQAIMVLRWFYYPLLFNFRIVNDHFKTFAQSVQSLSLTLCDPMDCSTPGLPVHHQLPESTQLMSIESVMPSNHLILCHPLLLPPSIFSNIRVFSNEMLTPWKESYDQTRQHIKKQRHYFANKGPSSQGYGIPSSHVWM